MLTATTGRSSATTITHHTDKDQSESNSKSQEEESLNSRDESNDGFLLDIVLLQVLSSLLLHRTTNLSNKNNTFRSFVLHEDFQNVDVLGSGERISSDSDAERLTESNLGGCVDSFVSESSGSGDDTYKRESLSEGKRRRRKGR